MRFTFVYKFLFLILSFSFINGYQTEALNDRSNKDNIGNNAIIKNVAIGTTTYELQTNAGISRRVVYSNSHEKVYIGWNFSNSFDGTFNDRGTGFVVMDINTGKLNSTNNLKTWGFLNFDFLNQKASRNFPNRRIEPTQMVGWPTLGITESGRQFSISHTKSSGLLFTYRDNDKSNWNEINIGKNVREMDGLWARAATDGDKIFVISSRRGVYNGIKGGVNVIRSLNNGQTWKVVGNLERDYSDVYGKMSGDSYNIDAKNGKVAVVYGGIYSQVNLYESSDDALSWKKTNILTNSNPLNKYSIINDFKIDSYFGANGGNALVIDSKGKVHLVYSAFFTDSVRENDFVNGGSFYPHYETSTLFYWSDGMEKPENIGITVLNDANNDGKLGSEFATYRPILSSLKDKCFNEPSIGIDEKDNLYVSYASIVDGHWQAKNIKSELSKEIGLSDEASNFNTDSVLLHEVFIIKKLKDEKWQGPINVSNSPETDDIYPCIARNIKDDIVHLAYHSDSIAGIYQQTKFDTTLNDTLNESIVRLATIDATAINNENAPKDSEPYISTNPLYQPCTFVIGCTDYNKDFIFYYFTALDYPDGILSEESIFLYGNVDYNSPGEYVEKIVAKDSNGNYSDTILCEVNVINDDQKPRIVFLRSFNRNKNGNPYLNLIIGTQWRLPEVIIRDNSDCELKPLLQISDNVNPLVKGTYTVTYDVKDYAGNKAKSKVIEVNVIDKYFKKN